MGFKELKSKEMGDVLVTKDMELGDSVEAYLTGIKETPNPNYPGTKNMTLFLQKDDGEKIVAFAAGTLKFIKQDLQDLDIPLGVKIRFTRAENPVKKSRLKYYFNVQYNEDDILDVEHQDGAFNGSESDF